MLAYCTRQPETNGVGLQICTYQYLQRVTHRYINAIVYVYLPSNTVQKQYFRQSQEGAIRNISACIQTIGVYILFRLRKSVFSAFREERKGEAGRTDTNEE